MTVFFYKTINSRASIIFIFSDLELSDKIKFSPKKKRLRTSGRYRYSMSRKLLNNVNNNMRPLFLSLHHFCVVSSVSLPQLYTQKLSVFRPVFRRFYVILSRSSIRFYVTVLVLNKALRNIVLVLNKALCNIVLVLNKDLHNCPCPQ